MSVEFMRGVGARMYCTVLYCTVLYCTALYCTVLYCTVLYCRCLAKLDPRNLLIARLKYNLIGLYGREPGYTTQVSCH